MVNLQSVLKAATASLALPGAFDGLNTATIDKQSEPWLNLSLTPVFGQGLVTALNSHILAELVIGAPTLDVDDPLVSLPLFIDLIIPTTQYKDDELTVTDHLGPLGIDHVDIDNIRTWRLKRKTEGDVKVSFRFSPRLVDVHTVTAPRSDFRADVGGLAGSGAYFLPLPPDNASAKKTYRNTVSWNLTQVPEGSRAVWTFGEGVGPLSHVGPTTVLSKTIYAVGAVKSYPTEESRTSDDHYGVYWFGDPPFNATDVSIQNRALFTTMSDFFHDTLSESNPYRTFIRSAEPARGYGGTGFMRSYVLEYDSHSLRPEDGQQEMTFLLAHEMVHNWALMDADAAVEEGDWYVEGVADYYATMLSLWSGMVTPGVFLELVNKVASMYYTNPTINMTNKEAYDNKWSSWHSQRLFYGRGAMYLFKVDAELYHIFHGEQSLQDIVLPMLDRLREGKSVTEKDWLELLAAKLGPKAITEYEEMVNGTLVVPQSNCLAWMGYTLVRRDQYMFDIGFDVKSFSTRVVSGIDRNSRAYDAGLRDGDEILTNTLAWQTGDTYQRNMVLSIARPKDGYEDKLAIEYWPRSWHKVESYQWEGEGPI